MWVHLTESLVWYDNWDAGKTQYIRGSVVMYTDGNIYLEKDSQTSSTPGSSSAWINLSQNLSAPFTAGKQTMYLPASVFITDSAQSPASALSAFNSNGSEGRVTVPIYWFGDATNEYIFTTFHIPKRWDRSGVDMKLYWTKASTDTGTAAWEMNILGLDDGDGLFGTGTGAWASTTGHVFHDTGAGTSGHVQIIEKTGIGINGDALEDVMIVMSVFRDVSDDTITGDIGFLGMRITYQADVDNDD
jgi:hypothetical protein